MDIEMDEDREMEPKRSKYVNQGANVRTLRNILGIKQEMLAEELGTTQQAVSYLEQRPVLKKDMLVRIAQVLNVPVKIIEELEENPLSVVIENNHFENGSYMGNGVGNTGVIENDQIQTKHNEPHIYPLDKVTELSNEISSLYERIIALEKERSSFLEQLLKDKKKE